MRVALFTDNDFDKVNGVTTTLKAVLRHTDGRAQPRVYTAADIGVNAPDYFSVPSFGVGLPWYREMRVYWPRVQRLASQLRADGIDVIHVTTPGPVGLAGRWLAARMGLPLVGSYHTHLGEYARTLSRSDRLGDWLDRYLRWFYGACEYVLVPSRATQQLLVSRGHQAERLRIWPRGVDTDQFSPERRSKELRTQWRVDARRPAVLYAGRLSAEKGLRDVPEIRRWLHRRAIEHQLVFVGDGPLLPELRRELPDAVFLGSVPHDRVAVAMASADVFLFPSATDSFGNVVLEAQACGLPTFVSDRGGPAEQIIDGETGVVCPAGQATAFAENLAPFLKSEAKRRLMGLAARRWAGHYSWSSALEPLVAAWRDAARGRAGVTGPLVLTHGRSVAR